MCALKFNNDDDAYVMIQTGDKSRDNSRLMLAVAAIPPIFSAIFVVIRATACLVMLSAAMHNLNSAHA